MRRRVWPRWAFLGEVIEVFFFDASRISPFTFRSRDWIDPWIAG
jgi:hypothetical protein